MTRRRSKKPRRRPSTRPRPSKKAGATPLKKALRFSFKWGLVAAIWGLVALAGLVAYFAHDLPKIEDVVVFKRRPAITLLASDGSLIGRIGDFRGSDVNAQDLPKHVIEAILATEDRRFYSHFGIDPIGLTRAMIRNIIAWRWVEGGSTITQQLAKNLFLTPDRTLKRKVQEALLAIQLEWRYTKNQILSAYLNRVFLGAGTYGLDAAAHLYFDKSAAELNVREAAVIAGLLKAPSRYAPSINPDEAAVRTATVLQSMVDAGYLTEEEKKNLDNVPKLPRQKPATGDGVRYFVDWVAEQAASYVGYEAQDLTVTTTLDPAVQRLAEEYVDAWMDRDGERLKASQAALVTLSSDGAVRAMIGGRVYQESQFNRATQALRQPGSSFKPIIYLAGLDGGLTPDTVFDDAPFQVGNWKPANFENEYRGSVSMRDALAYSLNSVAAQIIAQTGVGPVRKLARQLGITAPLGHDLSLALGTSEVTLLEMTGAYATLARLGQGTWPYAITEIRDPKGKILYKYAAPEPVQTVPADRVAMLNQLMMGPLLYGTGTAARLDRPAVGKTGTSQDYRDAWFMGFTADLITGVWVGNDDNSPMKKVTGGNLPARIWHDVMMEANAGFPAQPVPGTEMIEQETPIDTPLPEVSPIDQLENLLGRIIGQ